ncbi:hypothetical protein KI387_033552, partial [Taxus chinensis]
DALLFDVENGFLYRKPLTSNGVVDGMINYEGKLINDGSHKIPKAEAMLSSVRIKEPAIVDGNLHVITESSVVL